MPSYIAGESHDGAVRTSCRLRFTRGTDSLQRPVPVDAHSEPRRGSLSDRILIAETGALRFSFQPLGTVAPVGPGGGHGREHALAVAPADPDNMDKAPRLAC